MLRTLLESRPARHRTRSAAIISLAVHAAIVGTAVAGTRSVLAPDEPADKLPDVVFVQPIRERKPEPPRRQAQPEPARPEPSPAPTPTPTIVPPVEVPDHIAPPDPNAAPTVEPTYLPTTGTPGGVVGDGEPGGGTASGSEPYWADEVERAARPLGRQREPRYPDLLRAQRIEGRVVVSFVVDSLGRVEPNSIRMVESAHALFEPAVRQAVLATRFRPAEWRGRTVRQLVQQAFVFTLTR